MRDAVVLAASLASPFTALPHVVAVALGGSQTRDEAPADERSDLDLYVFTARNIPLETRTGIVAALGGGERAQLDQRFWGLSDQWIDPATGRHIDVNYFDAAWMQDAVLRVAERHEASLGYTTCFWRTVAHAVVLFDRTRWLGDLRSRVGDSYPEPLRHNIIALNHPVLRTIYTSYAAQIERAATRHDWVSVNHRIAAMLASYFDCLFAANRVLHPGEKRLVEFAETACEFLPEAMREDVEALLRCGVPGSAEWTGAGIDRLLDRLDAALRRAGAELPGA